MLRRDRIEWYKIRQTEGMQGSLLIDSSSIVDPQLNGGRLHSFSVTTDGVTLALSAANSAECGAWLEAVQARVRVMKLSSQEPASEQGRISYVEHQQSASDSEGEDGAPAAATHLTHLGASCDSGALGASAEASTGTAVATGAAGAAGAVGTAASEGSMEEQVEGRTMASSTAARPVPNSGCKQPDKSLNTAEVGAEVGSTASAALPREAPDRWHVAVRCRPPNRRELDKEETQALVIDSSARTVTTPGEHGTTIAFDAVYGADASQEEVYSASCAGAVQRAIGGQRVSIIAFGQTGTGKTYTIQGSQGHVRGMLPRAVDSTRASPA